MNVLIIVQNVVHKIDVQNVSLNNNSKLLMMDNVFYATNKMKFSIMEFAYNAIKIA